MQIFGVVYKITNMINGKVYIGQTTKTIEKRFQVHLQWAKRGEELVLYRAMRKYGVENFQIETLESCSNREELDDREVFYISHLNSFILFEKSNGYNMTLGAGGKSGYVHSEESRRKMSESSDRYGDKNSMYGKKHTNQSIELNKEKQPNSRIIVQLTLEDEFIAEHPSARECARRVNGYSGDIVKCCKGQSKTHKGYRFKYKEDYVS